MRRKSNLTRQIRKPPGGPVEGKIDTLIQGVSQQPKHLRVVGQGEEQLNGWSSPVEGLCKRNPLRLVGKILPIPVTDFYLEMMSVISGERYSVMVYPNAGGTSLLITRDGSPANVHVHGTGLTAVSALTLDPGLHGAGMGVTGDASSYIYNAAGDYQKKYVLINNGPLGLLLNREKVVAMSTDKTPAAKKEGLIFVQGTAYEVSYKLSLNGTEVGTYTTPKATDTNNELSTSTVATELAKFVTATTGFEATVDRHIVWVKKTDGGDFTIKLDDARGNSLARVVKDSVTSLAELPVVAPNGFIVNVSSDPSQTIDDRYLLFATTDGSAMGNGSWGETAKPGMVYKINPDTMPLVIFRKAPGVIFVGPADGSTQTMTVGGTSYSYTFPKWGDRSAGDETTVPDPEFIGKTVRDHVLFRGRYVMCAGQNVVFSEVDQVFNFFQDTSLGLTGKDGFSVLAVSEVSSELNWLLPLDENLLVFSQCTQFRVSAADADVLTPSTAMILRLSSLEMNPHIRPKLAGPQVLFGTNEFGYSHFREYSFYDTPQRRTGLNLGGSNDICLNIPKYIQGLVTHWDVGETIDFAACSTPNDRKTLYVYKYLFQSGGQALTKAQSSWSKFQFGGDVRWIKFMDNELWLIMTYPDGTYAAHITSDELEVASGLQPHLDRLLLYPECNADAATSNDVTATYDLDTKLTTFTLPYQVVGTARAVVRYTNPSKEGLLLGSATSGNQIVCDRHGDWTKEKVAIGEEFQFRYEFTTPYVESRDQGKQRIIGKLDGRTQLLTFSTFHHNAGRYDVRVQRQNRQLDSVHKFRSRQLNVMNNRLDTEHTPVETGQFRVPIYCQNTACRIFVESTSWLPVTITGAQWEGSYSNRARGN